MIRIVVADDHQLVRQSIVSLIEKAEDMEVVGEAADGPRDPEPGTTEETGRCHVGYRHALAERYRDHAADSGAIRRYPRRHTVHAFG